MNNLKLSPLVSFIVSKYLVRGYEKTIISGIDVIKTEYSIKKEKYIFESVSHRREKFRENSVTSLIFSIHKDFSIRDINIKYKLANHIYSYFLKNSRCGIVKIPNIMNRYMDNIHSKRLIKIINKYLKISVDNYYYYSFIYDLYKSSTCVYSTWGRPKKKLNNKQIKIINRTLGDVI